MDKTRVQAQFLSGVERGNKVAQKGSTGATTIPSEVKSETDSVFIPDQKPINVFQTLILKALNTPSLGKHIYAGTVDPVKVEKRRAKNKVARKQRKGNRG